MKTKRELRRDLIGAGIGLVLSGAYLMGALNIPNSSLIGKGVGADALPIGLAAIMAALAIALIAQTAASWPRHAPSGPTPEEIAEKATDRHRHLRAGGMLLIGIGALAALEWVGYIPTIFAMICITAVYSGRPMSWRVVALGAGLTTSFYLLFNLMLHIHLPAGIWPDLWRSITG